MSDSLPVLESQESQSSGKSDNSSYSEGKYCCLAFADFLLVHFLLTPCVVLAWYGLDQLINRIEAQNDEASAWLSFVLAFLVFLVLHMWQRTLAHSLVKDISPILWHVVTRLHTYLLLFACVSYRRGIFLLWETYIGHGAKSALVAIFLSIFVLWLLRTSRNVLGPPCRVNRDSEQRFTLTTRFHCDMYEDVYIYILDLLFTTFVVYSAVASLWFGFWSAMDLSLDADSVSSRSGWASLAIGYGLAILCYLFQVCISSLSKNLKVYPRTLVEDLFLLVTSFGVINVWRGVWTLTELYLSGYEWADWLTHVVGVLVLYAMDAARSSLFISCDIDGERGDGRGVLFPKYLKSLNKRNANSSPDNEYTVVDGEASTEVVQNIHGDNSVQIRKAFHGNKKEPWWSVYFGNQYF